MGPNGLQASGTLYLSVQPNPGAAIFAGEDVSIKANKQTQGLVTAAGGKLEDSSQPSNRSRVLTPIQALTKLVKQQGIQAAGALEERRAGDYRVRLMVYLPANLWHSPNIWKKTMAGASLFSHLQPLESAPTRDEKAAQVHFRDTPSTRSDSGSKANEYSLAACFSELPNHATDLEVPPLQIKPCSMQRYNLADVPQPLLQNVVARLNYSDVARLAHTCRFFRALADDATPGLLLSLFPHQRAAVQWMLAREQTTEQIPDPCWRYFCTEAGLPFWGCCATGEFRTEPPRPVHDSKGGLFCDEPGLGKTITGLALVLKTKGVLPDPPQNYPTQIMATQTGQKIGYYLLPPASAATRKEPQGLIFDKLSLPVGNSPAKDNMSCANAAARPSTRTVNGGSSTANVSASMTEQPSHDEAVQQLPESAEAVLESEASEVQNGHRQESGSKLGTDAGGASWLPSSEQLAVSASASSAWPAVQQDLQNGRKAGYPDKSDPRRSVRFAEPGSGSELAMQPSKVPSASKQLKSTKPAKCAVLQSQLPAGSMELQDPKKKRVKPQGGRFSGQDAQQQPRPRSVRFAESDSASGEPSTLAVESSASCRAKAEGVRFTGPDQGSPVPPGSAHKATNGTQQAGNGRSAINLPSAGPVKGIVSLEDPPAKRQKTLIKGTTERFEPADPEAGSGQLYVQCDICGKWRSLPPDTQVAEDAAWVCRMHPEPSKADCSSKQMDDSEQQQFDTCAGFVAASQPQGDESNICHFQQLLASYPDLVEARHSAIWWLAKQKPEILASGTFQIPRVHLDQSHESFALLLAEIGFVPLAKEQPAAVKKATAAQSPARRRRSTPTAASKVKAGLWSQSASLSKLHLDTEALRHVLQTGPAEVRQKVYLSAATLLVVPAPLVQHWLFQVQQHTAFNALRVLVISPDKERSSRMPKHPHSLAWDFDLVITTMTMLSAAWANQSRRCTSPFMQVHWLRVIVDEGHMLGNSLQMTNKLQMACALRADRRWLMTGTPTPGGPSSDIAHLQPLLAFLHTEPYGTEPTTWQEGVQKPFEARQPEGRRRLMDLISRTMIRAAKADLLTIPPLCSKVTILDFAPEHASNYNELVDVVHRNLLTSDWYDEDHEESLFNSRNAKWAREMLNNVKKSCCVAGNCALLAKEDDVKETLELLAERNNLPTVNPVGPPWVDSSHPLARLQDAMHSSCHCEQCGSHTRLPMVTPCAHLLCSTCASKDKLKCPLPGCGIPYVMQSADDPTRKEVNPLPKWEVPMELIEWQASYTQKGAQGISGGTWNENWQITKSTKCVHLLKRLYEIGAAINPAMPETWAQKVRRNAGGGLMDGRLTKAIVFSQFWMHILLIATHLTTHEVSFAVLKAGLEPAEKTKALDLFQNEDECGVLLMDQTGAVGLDLSFVSYVFLMEPIEDVSITQQVVSRAHRMGAKQPVHVETLAMKGTAEEQLLKLTAQEKTSKGLGATSLDTSSPEKERAEAQERSRRNHILGAMQRVPEASLPDYQDLPMSPVKRPSG